MKESVLNMKYNGNYRTFLVNDVLWYQSEGNYMGGEFILLNHEAEGERILFTWDELNERIDNL